MNEQEQMQLDNAEIDYQEDVQNDFQDIEQESAQDTNDDSAPVYDNNKEFLPSKNSDMDEKELSEWERWGKNEPENWNAYLQRKKKKKIKNEYETKIKELEEKSRELEQRTQQSSHSYNSNEEQNTLFIDPETGMQVDATTPEGEAILKEYAVKIKRQEHRNKQIQSQVYTAQKSHQQELVDDFETASIRNKEFDSVLNDAIKHSGPSPHIFDFISTIDDNKADFAFYLAKNKREWHRISSMQNPLLQHRELLKHFAQFNRSPKVSSAPPPSYPLSNRGISSKNSADSFAGAEAIMKAKYCKK